MIRLTPELRAALNQEVEQMGIPLTASVRSALLYYLEELSLDQREAWLVKRFSVPLKGAKVT